MPLDNTKLIQPKSDRVLRLTATCVQAVVRLRFAYDLSSDDAIELARIHDVRSAVEILGGKLELWRSIPEGPRFELAVAETKLAGGLIPAEDAKGTVEVRRGYIQTTAEDGQAGTQREKLILGLHELRREAEQWGREYGRFIDRLLSLYAGARKDLVLLRLAPETAKQAESELEQVLLVALHKADELETQVRASA